MEPREKHSSKPENVEQKGAKKGPVQIDVDELIKSKNPGLYKVLPRFVLSYLKRLIHQEDINAFIRKYHDRHGIDYVNAVLDEYNVKVETRGEENIPGKGRFFFVSNHPLGAFDGMAFVKSVHKHFPDVRITSNDLLLNLKNFEPIFVPINKHGKQSPEAIRKMEEIYALDNPVLFFPAGLVSRRQGKSIRDQEWKKTFITKAIKHKRDVIPVHISGRNSRRFYNIAQLRESLRIKSNIEMILLPSEMYRAVGAKLTVTFGKPIPYSTFDKSKKPGEWARWVKEKVYSLPKL